MLAGLPWWVAVPIGAAPWVGLAVVQEHDGRVPRPVDEVFVRAVRELRCDTETCSRCEGGDVLRMLAPGDGGRGPAS